jgi:hypothetical protein
VAAIIAFTNEDGSVDERFDMEGGYLPEGWRLSVSPELTALSMPACDYMDLWEEHLLPEAVVSEIRDSIGPERKFLPKRRPDFEPIQDAVERDECPGNHLAGDETARLSVAWVGEPTKAGRRFLAACGLREWRTEA